MNKYYCIITSDDYWYDVASDLYLNATTVIDVDLVEYVTENERKML